MTLRGHGGPLGLSATAAERDSAGSRDAAGEIRTAGAASVHAVRRG